MLSNKLFVIKDSYFNLPDDFHGTCGEALMLLAQYRLEQEEKNNINKENTVEDNYQYLLSNENIKCSIDYGLLKLTEDKKSWEKL